MNILILIVEDDKYMNETLCEVLESEGYNVESALSALDAINKIKHSEKYYHMLILDYNLQYLQGITGLDIYKMAKEKDPGVKAIMISAYGKDKELKEKARSKGINAFIDKPFLITDVIDTVDSILRHSSGKEAASQRNLTQ
ncbi:MAG TPA: response regulator [Ignavibacteria bacterium]|nr:response regulator [Ignavibacteria bacterium]